MSGKGLSGSLDGLYKGDARLAGACKELIL